MKGALIIKMGSDFLTEEEARKYVDQFIETEEPVTSTQDILDSGAIPRLRGYVVKPGKVSDSIFGGRGSFVVDGQFEDFDDPSTFVLPNYKLPAENPGVFFKIEPIEVAGKEKTLIEFVNPPLVDAEGTPLRLMVRTARVSTHDIVRGMIPFKDQILALNHNFMRRMMEPYLGTSQFEVPGLEDNSVVIAAEELEQIPFENVLRAYMAKSSTSTSLYQHFIKGGRNFCGHALPDDLITNGPLPYVMDTPSTKSDEHDESVSPEVLFERGLVSPQDYQHIRNASIAGFGAATQYLAGKGIILVDTKLEHGRNRRRKIVVQDEVLTMDSSRFWLANDYFMQRLAFTTGKIKEINPMSYSKEFARGMSEGEKGYTDEQRALIGTRYIMGIQHLTGRRFEPDIRQRDERVIRGLEGAVQLARTA